MTSPRGVRIGLIALQVVGSVSAAAGAVGLLGGGIEYPTEWLTGSPFTSYTIPGLILGVVVGGSQLAGLIAVLRRHDGAPQLSALVGAIMMGWIIAEVLIVGSIPGITRNLQVLYFLLGLAEVGLVALWIRAREYAR
ncbi:hypothetical protein [Sphaerobacter thermophilus]|uniref:DUF4345 domain-containing protein n=1 Tax=Sphaerobacter thermophilus (strain ATCC 49802 / DSM 20745 / KCCM 41009 / NCIMB 13125 / S 6022) TaxID=479434 RepID=D1C496_SPHTD|nr:hypothetical protein [Sphaerobacter thermophilus]ACZ39063.1 hypothetical protein Sthe_1629 [Sphaerobacter thermophilus DSM 20745]